uniref:Uncharacterized protein n=1 Tax=Arundo donax TaxID=35708 RepID=A0A0A9F1E8_ARUDO
MSLPLLKRERCVLQLDNAEQQLLTSSSISLSHCSRLFRFGSSMHRAFLLLALGR